VTRPGTAEEVIDEHVFAFQNSICEAEGCIVLVAPVLAWCLSIVLEKICSTQREQVVKAGRQMERDAIYFAVGIILPVLN
jgi:hypothetical protein